MSPGEKAVKVLKLPVKLIILFGADRNYGMRIPLFQGFRDLSDTIIRDPFAILNANLFQNFFLSIRKKKSSSDEGPEIISLP